MDDIAKYPLYPAYAKMQDGDAILYSGTSPVSKAIMYYGLYSHATIVNRNDAGLIREDIPADVQNHSRYVDVAEASFGPLRLANLHDQVTKYHGKVYWLPANMTEDQRGQCRHHVLRLLGKRIQYDLWGLAKNAFGRINSDLERLWCSEFVVTVWYLCGKIRCEDMKRNRPWDLPKLIGREPMELIVP